MCVSACLHVSVCMRMSVLVRVLSACMTLLLRRGVADPDALLDSTDRKCSWFCSRKFSNLQFVQLSDSKCSLGM